jgi:hypothetical protein
MIALILLMATLPRDGYWFEQYDSTLTKFLLAPSYLKAQTYLENHQHYRKGRPDDGGINALQLVVSASRYPKRIPTVIKAIDWLIERGAKPSSPADEGAVLTAALSDRTGAVLAHLLTKGGRPLQDSDALWHAAWVVSPQNVSLLLKAGADPNKSWGRSEKGGSVESKIRFSYTIPEYQNGGWKQWLRTSPLMVSSFGNDPASVKLLLSYKANPNAVQPDSGSTALHFAARGNYPEIVQMLLNAGAKKNMRNKRRETPLAVARRFKATKVIALLR